MVHSSQFALKSHLFSLILIHKDVLFLFPSSCISLHALFIKHLHTSLFLSSQFLPWKYYKVIYPSIFLQHTISFLLVTLLHLFFISHFTTHFIDALNRFTAYAFPIWVSLLASKPNQINKRKIYSQHSRAVFWSISSFLHLITAARWTFQKSRLGKMYKHLDLSAPIINIFDVNWCSFKPLMPRIGKCLMHSLAFSIWKINFWV